MENAYTDTAEVQRPIYLAYRNTNAYMVVFPDLSILNFSTGQGADSVMYMNLLPPSRGHLGHELKQSSLNRILEVHDQVPYSLITDKLEELIQILNKALREMHYHDGENSLEDIQEQTNTEVPY